MPDFIILISYWQKMEVSWLQWLSPIVHIDEVQYGLRWHLRSKQQLLWGGVNVSITAAYPV